MSQQNSSVCSEKTYITLYNSHAETLRNFIYYKCGDSYEAEDIVQESFIKLWKNCSKVPFEKARSFLYTVANNLFLNIVAHQKVVLRYAREKPDDTDRESPQFVLEEKEYMEKLQTAIANLSEAQRTAFLLHRIDGKKYAEIAEILGISVKAVEKRIHKALVSLRKEIEGF
ncbi:RNA polymerase sigma factor [Sinomicrobium weinanense]|uniref:RNA polymerase sigma factor n=1 Tax=Sinomicrobium weinanense TaxID=2842200 RepID=A0A926JQV2_9FLAO|nr:RNA polymerase sigma factor [Sinomicrobium weinanense]MBC9795618.1 RNA polymerase sigma factor [Sinomicrobium weinanense]MBU3124639.1 RNA polymerase sigma factor [Sinomicrobium weinanense]